ncbi:MAG: LysM peptidoglycan-binding domain-containing protein [Bacteroidota bacterium]
MTLQDKYSSVLKLGEDLNIQDGFIQEEDGVLKMGGVAADQYAKDQIWNEIKKVAGEDAPGDLVADITVATTEYYTKHTVKSGESLSLIAKHYSGDPMKYKAIFEANTGTLKDPNVIHPGQELVIPFLD